MQAGTLAWANERAKGWLQTLGRDLIGPGKRMLCGDSITIADYLGAEMVATGDLTGCDLTPYPNIERWMGRMKALPAWPKVHAMFEGFAGSLEDKPFVTL